MTRILNLATMNIFFVWVLVAQQRSGGAAPVVSKGSPATSKNSALHPLVFHPTGGRQSPGPRFTARGQGYTLHFTNQETTFFLGNAAHTATLRMKVVGASRGATVNGIDELPGKVNYLIGNDRAKWRTGIPTYGKVLYQNVIDGVDLIYYGRNRQLEYDFRLSPGTDPAKIQMAIEGAGWKARLAPSGDLEIRGASGSLRFDRPVAYQLAADGSHEPVEARYALKDARHFGFQLGKYDRKRALVIDPSLVYSTYYGGAVNDFGRRIAIDAQGNAYITGYTIGADLPGTAGGVDSTAKANPVAFVAKFNSSGSQLLAATYLGGTGTGGNFPGEIGNGIAVDSNGNVIVVGRTRSQDFPLRNAVQSSCGPAATINTFSCAYTPVSTCTSASDHPDGFIAKLDSTLSQLAYSTYLGGSGNDNAASVAVNSAGEAFVVGATSSVTNSHAGCPATAPSCGQDQPDAFGITTTPNAYMQTPVNLVCGASGPFARTYAWIAAFSPTGTLDYFSYFGPPSNTNGFDTSAYDVALDGSGKLYVTGATSDTGFASIPGTITSQCMSCANTSNNAWAAKFNLGQLIYNNLFGGTGNDHGNGIAVDGQGNAYIAGYTNSPNFPATAGSLRPTWPGNESGFVTKLNPQGSAQVYSTYIGSLTAGAEADAIVVDAAGAATVTGNAGDNLTFPLVNPIQTNSNGAYVARLTPDGGGTLFSTRFGANTTAVSVALDNSGNAYITGSGGNATPTTGAYQTCANLCAPSLSTDAYVAKINIIAPSPTITSPASGSVFTSGSVTFSWAAVAGATKYKLEIGSSAGAGDLFSQETTATSLLVSGLPTDGRALFVQISSFSSGAFSTPAATTYRAFLSTPLQLITVAPCRVFDSRNVNGPLGGPFIAAGTTRIIPVPSSSCGIPSSASAYSLNVTVVPRNGTLGFLTVWPAGQPQPNVSTLNSPDGTILANAAIAPAGTAGAINAFALNDSELIVDINGYFVPPAGNSLQFFPLPPCRLLDTRNANGTFGGPAITGGASRSFPFPASSCGVPANAAAYSLNVTAAPQGFLGFVTAFPTGQSLPNVSTLNSLDGTILANAAIVPAGASGAVSFYANNTTNLVVDINGYFAAPATGGRNFFSATPCRLVDTRNTNGALGGPVMSASATRTFPLPTSSCGLPSPAAYALNVTVVPSGPLGFLTIWPTGQAQPFVSTLNAPKGIVVANAALVPAGTNGSVDVFVLQSTHVIIDTNGYFQ